MFGFVPALQSSRVDLVSVINEDASPRGASRGRLRAGLVVAQVAVSLLLLVGAGLATRSVEAARRANPGFDASHVTALAVDVKQNGYDESRGRVFYRELLDAARADAGIESATLAAYTPLAFLDTRAQRVAIEGYEPRRGEDLAFMSNTVGPDYFRTLRISLMAGRAFEDRDDETAAPVAIVNNTLARTILGRRGERDRQAGPRRRRRLANGDRRGGGCEVLADQRSAAPVLLPAVPAVVSVEHDPAHARARRPSTVLVDQARAQVRRSTPICRFCTPGRWPKRTRGALILFDLMATMLFIFGVAGMALAAMGTYGLVSYTVKQSTHEIGIRMALGASGLSVVRRFLGTRPAARRDRRRARYRRRPSASAGFSAACCSASAPPTAISFARALAIVLGGVIVATIVPAWRAARTNPLSALRHQ